MRRLGLRGWQEAVPRGAIQAHSRFEHLFRVRAAPSGDLDCPAKAIVLPPPPSPSQASLNLKSDIFSSPPFWLSPPWASGWRPGLEWWGRENSHLGTGIFGSHSEGCRLPLRGQRLGNLGIASPEPGPRRGSRGRSLGPAGEGLWSGSPRCGREALSVRLPWRWGGISRLGRGQQPSEALG